MDAVISTFGVMFASRPEAAASELARVVKPGGRVVLSSWKDDSNVAALFGESLDDARREEFKKAMVRWHETFGSPLGYDQPRTYWITHAIRK